jgi:hypothetical protein
MHPAGLAPGRFQGRARIVVGHQEVGIPSRRRRRRSGSGGISSFSASGAPAGPLPPNALRDKLADATGYPLPTPVLRQANTPAYAITTGQQRHPLTRPDQPIKAPDGAVGAASKPGLTGDHPQRTVSGSDATSPYRPIHTGT